MSRRRISLFVCLLIGLMLSGCGPFDFNGQDLTLRHDVREDSLELELTYRGVHKAPSYRGVSDREEPPPPSTASLKKAVKALDAMSRGGRSFMIFSSFFAWDLDRAVTPSEPGPWEDFERRCAKWVQGISVLACRIDHDERGQLRVYQKLQLPEISKGVALLNEGWCISITEWSRTEDYLRGAGFLDDASREALVAAAARGEGPFGLREGTLTLSFPVSSASVARLLKLTSKELGRDVEETGLALSFLLGSVSDLRIEEDRVSLTYAPDDAGALQFELSPEELEYDATLDDYLRSKWDELPREYSATNGATKDAMKDVERATPR